MNPLSRNPGSATEKAMQIEYFFYFSKKIYVMYTHWKDLEASGF